MRRTLPLILPPILVLLEALVLCGSVRAATEPAPASRPVTPPGGTRVEAERRILRLAKEKEKEKGKAKEKARGRGSVETVPLEAYVAAVLPAEIGGHSPRAALEAQAVAARSYAIAQSGRHADRGADLCDGVHCQVFRGLWSATPASRAAAEATRGLVLVREGRVIAAPFHAACGGRTARPADVWDDEETPDLVPVEDDACGGASGSVWTYRIPRRSVPLLAARLGFPDGQYLEVWGRDGTGRVAAVRLAAPGGASRTVRGFEFRRAASALWGWDSVRSTLFDVGETRDDYVLAGRGTGHGAGLCQSGAIERARRGETARQILALYYGGAQVVPLAGAPAPAPARAPAAAAAAAIPVHPSVAVRRVTAAEGSLP